MTKGIAEISPRTGRRERLLTLLLPLGAIGFAIALAEVVFRLAGYGNAVQYRYLPEIGWVHQPNQQAFTVGRKPVRINSLGLRGPELSRIKTDSVFRILLLGDSFTFGYGVGDDSTYGRQLERLFLARQPYCAEVEVLNAGVNGYNTAQEMALLRHTGLSLAPDLVVLGFTPNDIMDQDQAKTMLRWPILKELLARSALYQFTAPRVKALILRQAGRAYSDTLSMFLRGVPAIGSRAAVLGKELTEFRRLGAAQNFKTTVILFPFAQQVHGGSQTGWPPRLREATDSNHLPVLDLLPVFQDAVAQGKRAFLDEPTHHPNGQGQYLAATALYSFLHAHRLIPECMSNPNPRVGQSRPLAVTR